MCDAAGVYRRSVHRAGAGREVRAVQPQGGHVELGCHPLRDAGSKVCVRTLDMVDKTKNGGSVHLCALVEG